MTSGNQTSTSFNEIKVSDKTMTVELNDPNGLDAYAVTTSSTAPEETSSEWIEITDETAKSNVRRTASDKITSKTITYTVENDGVYYLHVRNDIKQITKKQILIGKGSEQTISFDANGGNEVTTTKVISFNGIYGELPTPTRNGYVFTGWYTSSSGGQAVTESSVYSNVSANVLYAGWEPSKYVVTFDANGGTNTESTKEVTYTSTYGTLPSPTHNNGTFIGWFTQAVGGEQVLDTTEVTTISNQTLYAHWSIKATTKIMTLAETNTNELRIDEHEATGQQTFAATEYRYWGANPNNYVKFNGELWRIIGAMDVDNGNGTVEKRLKIIRKDIIGSYSWDTSESSINNGLGINEWSQADLMTLLNSGAYYNRAAGTCYVGQNNTTKECDFTSTGLTSEAKEMIGDAKWYSGASPLDFSTLTSTDFYTYERGTTTGKTCTSGGNCNDTVERTTSWVGKIGLIYLSDYGYGADMESCSSVALDTYNTSCKNTAWLDNSSINQWTLTPYPYTSFGTAVLRLSTDTTPDFNGGVSAFSVSPVTYLKTDIKIIDGNGSSSQPFILSK